MLHERTYPTIEYIEDVLPHIVGYPEFIKVEKDGYTVINYAYQDENTFPPIPPAPTRDVKIFLDGQEVKEDLRKAVHIINADTPAILRECRGLIFCAKTGKLLRRSFHKFFNAGEKPETNPDLLPLDNHLILDKLDGSMVTPFMRDDHIRWATKMGITDTSMAAEVFVAKNPRYTDFAKMCISLGNTPIFEWLDADVPIVIKHQKDDMILLAIRHNISGEYAPYEALKGFAKSFNIPIVNAGGWQNGAKFLMEETKKMEGVEGFVMVFQNGEMVKVKSDWYVQIHRTKDELRSVRRQIACFLDNTLDDLIVVLLEADRALVNENIKRFREKLEEKIYDVSATLHAFHYTYQDNKKAFAINASNRLDRHIRSLIFSLWDGKKSPREQVTNLIRKHLNGEKDFQQFNKDFLCLKL